MLQISQSPRSAGPTLICSPAFQIRTEGHLLIGEFATMAEALASVARIDATSAWVNRHPRAAAPQATQIKPASTRAPQATPSIADAMAQLTDGLV